MSLHEKMRSEDVRGYENQKYLEDDYSSDLKSDSNKQKEGDLDQTEVKCPLM